MSTIARWLGRHPGIDCAIGAGVVHLAEAVLGRYHRHPVKATERYTTAKEGQCEDGLP